MNFLFNIYFAICFFEYPRYYGSPQKVYVSSVNTALNILWLGGKRFMARWICKAAAHAFDPLMKFV